MTNNNNTTNRKKSYSLNEAIERVNSEPKPKMIYSGIKENTFGFIFGPSKSGKSTYCEALGMSIACGAEEFLGIPIESQGQKVLFISLEEYYQNRVDRNSKQLNELEAKYGKGWRDYNYEVNMDELPMYIDTDDEWELVKKEIVDSGANVVFIDSLTHLYTGSIEDSSVAKKVMTRLKNLVTETKTTIICIHHSTKMYDRALTMDTMAGSRVLAQEADFLIGINKSSSGVRYIKEVLFRYTPSDDEFVKTFKINENNWIELIKEDREYKLLAPQDGRSNSDAINAVNQFLSENPTGKINDIKDMYMEYGKTKQAFSKFKQRLIEQQEIIVEQDGTYKVN